MRRGEPPPQAFQAPVDVHASIDGQVYMFRGRQDDLAGSSEDEEEELNVLELKPRNRDSSSQERERIGEIQLLERDISQDDNLNKLALQYGCKVADIKRVNNLIQEQDLYALKSIKIPVKKHGLLTQTNTELREPQPVPPSRPSHSSSAGDSSSTRPQVQEYTDFLREVDSDIERLIQSTDAREDAFRGGSAGLRRLGFRGQRWRISGADWGIQWWNAVVAMLLIGIVLPIFYMVYFKTRSHGLPGADDEMVNTSLTTSNSSLANLSVLHPKGTIGIHIGEPQT